MEENKGIKEPSQQEMSKLANNYSWAVDRTFLEALKDSLDRQLLILNNNIYIKIEAIIN